LNQAKAGQVWQEAKSLSLVSNRSSNEKPKGNKSQDTNCYKESTISCDKKLFKPTLYWQEKKISKESIDKCKKMTAKTRTAQREMIKKVQNNKVILMGMGMQINNYSGRSRTAEESTVSNKEMPLIPA
jgi:hypothetical protein